MNSIFSSSNFLRHAVSGQCSYSVRTKFRMHLADSTVKNLSLSIFYFLRWIQEGMERKKDEGVKGGYSKCNERDMRFPYVCIANSLDVLSKSFSSRISCTFSHAHFRVRARAFARRFVLANVKSGGVKRCLFLQPRWGDNAKKSLTQRPKLYIEHVRFAYLFTCIKNIGVQMLNQIKMTCQVASP